MEDGATGLSRWWRFRRSHRCRGLACSRRGLTGGSEREGSSNPSPILHSSVISRVLTAATSRRFPPVTNLARLWSLSPVADVARLRSFLTLGFSPRILANPATSYARILANPATRCSSTVPTPENTVDRCGGAVMIDRRLVGHSADNPPGDRSACSPPMVNCDSVATTGARRYCRTVQVATTQSALLATARLARGKAGRSDVRRDNMSRIDAFINQATVRRVFPLPCVRDSSAHVRARTGSMAYLMRCGDWMNNRPNSASVQRSTPCRNRFNRTASGTLIPRPCSINCCTRLVASSWDKMHGVGDGCQFLVGKVGVHFRSNRCDDPRQHLGYQDLFQHAEVIAPPCTQQPVFAGGFGDSIS